MTRTRDIEMSEEKKVVDLFIADVKRTAGVYATNPALAALGLCTELGEFFADGGSMDEAGDVLWHAAVLAPHLGLAIDKTVVPFAETEQVQLDALLLRLDHVKKFLVGHADRRREASAAVMAAVARALHPYRSREEQEIVMLLNMAKREKRFPGAAPEVVALLKERGYL